MFANRGILTSTWFDRLSRTVLYLPASRLIHRLGCLQIRVPDFLSCMGDELVINKKEANARREADCPAVPGHPTPDP